MWITTRELRRALATLRPVSPAVDCPEQLVDRVPLMAWAGGGAEEVMPVINHRDADPSLTLWILRKVADVEEANFDWSIGI
jgi:hypothetical protein